MKTIVTPPRILITTLRPVVWLKDGDSTYWMALKQYTSQLLMTSRCVPFHNCLLMFQSETILDPQSSQQC